MMFKSGAGVEVIENKHYMAARVFLPWEFVVSISLLSSKIISYLNLRFAKDLFEKKCNLIDFFRI